MYELILGLLAFTTVVSGIYLIYLEENNDEY